jgi:hypothetical protein
MILMKVCRRRALIKTDFRDFRTVGSEIPEIGFDELCDDQLK